VGRGRRTIFSTPPLFSRPSLEGLGERIAPPFSLLRRPRSENRLQTVKPVHHPFTEFAPSTA